MAVMCKDFRSQGIIKKGTREILYSLFSTLIHKRYLFLGNVVAEIFKVVLANRLQEGDGEIMVANITSGVGKTSIRISLLSRFHRYLTILHNLRQCYVRKRVIRRGKQREHINTANMKSLKQLLLFFG